VSSAAKALLTAGLAVATIAAVIALLRLLAWATAP